MSVTNPYASPYLLQHSADRFHQSGFERIRRLAGIAESKLLLQHLTRVALSGYAGGTPLFSVKTKHLHTVTGCYILSGTGSLTFTGISSRASVSAGTGTYPIFRSGFFLSTASTRNQKQADQS